MRLLGRSLLRDDNLTLDEVLYLTELANTLREERRDGAERQRLRGRNVALIFEKASTRTRSAFEVAAHDQGAHVTYLGPDESQFGHKESAKDSARVLARMFDAIEFRGYRQDTVETLAAFAGVPVYNGLTDEWHPTQALADVRTIADHVRKPFDEVAVCYVGDARNNTASSLIVTCSILGMDVRVACPPDLFPSDEVLKVATKVGEESDGRLSVISDAHEAVRGADVLYTDVWVSMGEPPSAWDDRIPKLLPYQVNADLVAATGNEDVKFLHCLPALHDLSTEVGREVAGRYGLDALEVTDDVFESPHSVVFDQAENRLHTIKALLVATIGDR